MLSTEEGFVLRKEAGARIRKLRESKLMTQVQFAKLLGITEQYVCKIESGHSLSIKIVFEICEKTEASADYILFGKNHISKKVDFLNDLPESEIDMILDALKEVIRFAKTKSANELMIKGLLWQKFLPQ